MVPYDGGMVTKVRLPDEAPDMTVSELHERVVNRLVDILRFLLADQALVLSEIFLRVRGRDGHDVQASADILIVPGVQPGSRSVYWVPDEPVPALTIEILSPSNQRSEGAAELANKRALFARIGVANHLEIDPDRGQTTTWVHDGTELVAQEPATTCTHPALGGLRIEAIPGQIRTFLPDGREFIDAPTEISRADTEAARATRMAEALRRAGIDPDTV